MTYLLILAASLGFSGHCLAMCGVFPAALNAGSPGGVRAAFSLALYHAGKIATYVFLGVLAASAGLRLLPWHRQLGIAAGALLVVVGLAGLVPSAVAPRLVRWVQVSPLCVILSGLFREPRPISALSVGVFNGFVPCGLVYAIVAHAATLGSIPRAALAMFCFGLGTVPALTLAGFAGRVARAALRAGAPRLVRVSGALTVLLGILTILRAGGALHAHAP